MQKIILIGNSIAAEILFAYLELDNRYEVTSFCVDKEYIDKTKLFDIDVIDFQDLEKNCTPENYKVMLAMGYNNVNQDRAKMFDRIKKLGYEIETYIHPNAIIFNKNNIGEGSVILANTVIEPYTVIGKNSYIWTNCTIAHHSVIEDHCWIASSSVISGEAHVKSYCFLGVSSTIVNKVIVEELNIIGAGAMISKNTKRDEVYLSGSGQKHRFNSCDYAQYIGI